MERDVNPARDGRPAEIEVAVLALGCVYGLSLLSLIALTIGLL